MNRRQQLAIGLVFGAMALFIAGLNLLDGDRLAQSVIAAIYAVAVLLLARWGNRAAA
jgi:hypothetical protein